MTPIRWPVVVVAAATVLAYGNSLRNGFVWDDDRIIVHNATNRSLGNIGTILTVPDVLGKGDPTTYYRPLSRLSYAVEYQLFGLEPLGYHVLSVLAHLAAALLLFFVAKRLLGAELPALLAALLLAVHPIHSEPVNLVSGRNTLLAAAFMLASYGAYQRWRESGRHGTCVAAVLLFGIGLLCKETALMLLPFLVLFEPLAPGGRPGMALRRRAPALGAFALLAAAYLGVRSAVLPSMLGDRVPAGHLSQAFTNVLHSIPKYAATVLWPTRLTVLYADPDHYFRSPVALAVAWASIAAVGALLLLQRRSATRVGLLWFAVNFIPVSTIVPFPSAAIADRFLYVPLIGIWLVVADQVHGLVEVRPALRTPALAVASVLLVALGIVTFRRNLDWRDDVTLFEAAVRAEPESALAHYTLGVVHANAGNPGPARDEWRRALDLDPMNVDALSQLGTYHAERNELGEAERLFRRVLQLDGRDAEAHFNLALLLERTGRPADALLHYARFVEAARGESADMIPRVRARMRQLEARLPPVRGSR